MNGMAVRHRLLDKGVRLVELARMSGISYDRLIRLVNGYRTARPSEIEAIARVLEVDPSELTAAVQSER